MVLSIAAAMVLAVWEPGYSPSVEWVAPDRCPDRAAVVTAIEQYLGRPLEGSAESPIVAVARVDEGPTAVALTLAITTEAGTSQTLARSEACDVLVKLAALKIAIAIDPEAGMLGVGPSSAEVGPTTPVAPQPPRPPSDRPPPRTKPISVSEPIPVPEPPPASALGVSLRADVAVQAGLLPQTAVGVGAVIGLRVRAFSVHAGFDRWLSPASTIEPPHPATVKAAATMARLGGCGFVPLRPTLELPLCATFEGGLLAAGASGLQAAHRTRQPWLALEGGLHVAWVPIPRVAWWLGVPLVVPLVRPGLRTDDGGLFYRAAPVGVRPTTTIEVRFR